MSKPLFQDYNVDCPECACEGVALRQLGPRGVNTAIVIWCENGHVYVWGETGGKVVHTFR